MVEAGLTGTTEPQAELSHRTTATPSELAAALGDRAVIVSALLTLVISIGAMTIVIGAKRIGGHSETAKIEMILSSSATSSHVQIRVHPLSLAHLLMHPSHKLRRPNVH